MHLIPAAVKGIFYFLLPIFGVWTPGTHPIGSAAKFPAISMYRFVRSSHMGPIQAKNHVPAKHVDFLFQSLTAGGPVFNPLPPNMGSDPPHLGAGIAILGGLTLLQN